VYTSVRGVTPDRPGSSSGRPPAGKRRTVGSVVVLLGTVSLLTDLSSEMVAAVLPVYLTIGLGLTPVQYGIVDGLYQGVRAAVSIVAGVASDATRRPKLIAALGYGLSAVCKLALIPAQGFAAISAVVSADRTGKGIRTAPRDAMIAASVPTGSLGLAFGVHRAMDTVGAMGGPLIAFLLLARLPDSYHALFVLSFCLGLIGLAVLVLGVPSQRPPRSEAGTPVRAPVLRTATGLLRRPGYRRLVIAAGLLSVMTVSDGFVYLSLQQRADIGVSVFPLLFVGTSLVYLALAIPMGRLADRFQRRWVFLGGHLCAVAGYLLLLTGLPGKLMICLVLFLLGVYYAATDGVLAALAASMVPDGARGTGFGVIQTVVAVGRLVAAIGFGALWTVWSRTDALLLYSVGLLLSIAAARWLLRSPVLNNTVAAG
jgi:MFS family permease